jgi:hypothetical protein
MQTQDQAAGGAVFNAVAGVVRVGMQRAAGHKGQECRHEHSSRDVHEVLNKVFGGRVPLSSSLLQADLDAIIH